MKTEIKNSLSDWKPAYTKYLTSQVSRLSRDAAKGRDASLKLNVRDFSEEKMDRSDRKDFNANVKAFGPLLSEYKISLIANSHDEYAIEVSKSSKFDVDAAEALNKQIKSFAVDRPKKKSLPVTETFENATIENREVTLDVLLKKRLPERGLKKLIDALVDMKESIQSGTGHGLTTEQLWFYKGDDLTKRQIRFNSVLESIKAPLRKHDIHFVPTEEKVKQGKPTFRGWFSADEKIENSGLAIEKIEHWLKLLEKNAASAV